jgi:hypothetical protein
MGSTICVRCGATLIPHSYCDICRDVLCFTCSSCSMITDERIHTYCRDITIQSNDNVICLQNPQKSMDQQYFHQIYSHVNAYCIVQKQLNDEIKDSSIKLSASYWESICEFIKLVSKCWNKISNISNSSIT